MGLILAMGLAACGPKTPTSSEKPSDIQSESSEEPGPSTEESQPEPSTQESQPGPSSQESQPGPSSQEVPADAAMAANGIDIVEEGGKVYAKVTGSISGFANADQMKMAFGIVTEAQEGSQQTYILGSATPADADYSLVPTVDATAGTFELKVDLSAVQWVGGTFTAMVGPKGFYAAVASTGGTYGTGKSVVGGFRISIRSHNGTIAADELPPVSLTISRIEVEGDKVYHVIGGALNTTKLPKDEFLAKHPYVQYEATTVGWSKNVMGSSTKTDLVTVSVDEAGNALIKTDITSLGANGYNIKINLNGDTDVDTKMDAIIDETEHPVAFGMYDYVPYAVSTESDKAHLYGNCGLFINTANRYVNAGEKFADLQPVMSKEGEIAYEMVAADCEGQSAPKASDKNTRLGKGSKLTDVWDITGIRSGEYEVYVKAAYSAGNGKSYWSGAQNVELNRDQESNNGNPYNPGARYNVKIDSETAVDFASDKTYADCGMVEAKDDGAWTSVALAKVMVPDGSKSLTITNNNNGYAIWVYAVRIVRVGNWARPATPLVFNDDGFMRVEAENYHEASSDNPAMKTEDGATFIDHVGGWPQFNASYKFSVAQDVRVKIKLHYAWYSGQWGKYGTAEFTVDGGSKIKDENGKENLAQADENMTGEWLDIVSAEFDLAAGEHTFKFQTPGGCTVSWDYFDIIFVPAA